MYLITNTTTATSTGFNGQADTACYAAGFAETLNITIDGTIFYDYFLGSVYEMDMHYRNVQAFNASYDYRYYTGTVDSYLKGSSAWVRALRRFTI